MWYDIKILVRERKKQRMGIMKKKRKTDLNDQIDVEKMSTAYHLIASRFRSMTRDTYLRGKTIFRDFLYDKMGCSLLEAEILVDALEKNGKIDFRRLRKGMRHGTWEIH
jgi:hypothetical protein